MGRKLQCNESKLTRTLCSIRKKLMLHPHSFSLLSLIFFVAIASNYAGSSTLNGKRHLLAKRAVNIARLPSRESYSPKISVILPAYNVIGHGKFERAVHSILEQTFIDFELVLVDDGSKDATKALINHFAHQDKRVVGVFLRENGGLPNALNAGLNRSTAELITWTSSDNYLESNFLEYFYKASLEYPESNFFFSDWNLVDADNNLLVKSHHDYRAPYSLFLQWQGCAAFMWRKKVNKFFDTTLGGVEDHEMWIRISEGQNVNVWIQNTLYNYTFNHGSWEKLSSSGALKKMVNDMTRKTYNRHLKLQLNPLSIMQSFDRVNFVLNPFLLFPSLRFNFNIRQALSTAFYRLGTIISADLPGPDGGIRLMLRQLLPHLYRNSITLKPEFHESRFNKLLATLASEGWSAAQEEFYIMKDIQAKSKVSSGLAEKLKVIQDHYERHMAKEDSRKISILYENDNCIFFDESFTRERQLLSAYEIQFFHRGRDVNEIFPDDVGTCDEGYHTKLRVGVSDIKRPYRLAVIPSDPLNAYELGGYANWLQDYYNPLNFFDEVFLLSPVEVHERVQYGMYIIPTQPQELAARIQQLGIHLVRAYGGYWPCDMATFGKVPGVPVVVSVHDTNANVLHDSIVDADYILPVSRAVAKLVAGRFKAKGVEDERIESKLYLFSNRVDDSVFNPNLLKSQNLQVNGIQSNTDKLSGLLKRFPGKYRILHIGRRKHQKNWDTLLKSLAILGKEYVLIMIGRGDKIPIRMLAEDLNISSQIHLIDTVENSDIPYYHAITDVFATVSRWEGFGIVFIEALAVGKSVVVTSDIAPMNEYIQNGFNGLLVEHFENASAVATAITLAIHNKTLRTKILANSRKSVNSFFKSNVDRWEVQLNRLFLHSGTT